MTYIDNSGLGDVLVRNNKFVEKSHVKIYYDKDMLKIKYDNYRRIWGI